MITSVVWIAICARLPSTSGPASSSSARISAERLSGRGLADGIEDGSTVSTALAFPSCRNSNSGRLTLALALPVIAANQRGNGNHITDDGDGEKQVLHHGTNFSHFLSTCNCRAASARPSASVR